MTAFGRKVHKEELLAVWRRLMDPEYTVPLENESEGRGFDVIAGLAAVMERASEAVQMSTQSLYLKEHSAQLDDPATGAVQAFGMIEIFRRDLLGGDINLQAGDVLVMRWQDTEGEWVDGVEVALWAPAVIPPAVEGPTQVNVIALRAGPQGNAPAGRVVTFVRRGRATVPLTGTNVALGFVEDTASLTDEPDMFTADMVGRYFRFADGPNASRPAYRIVAFYPTDGATVGNIIELDRLDWDEVVAPGTTGLVLDIADLGIDAVIVNMDGARGRHAELDMLAAERGQGRATGESDASLRRRVGDLVDVVSPDAIVRTVAGILGTVPFQLIEIGTLEGRGFVLNLDAFNDPTAFAHGRFFYGATGAWAVFGFIIVIDGTALPADEAPLINAIRNVVNTIKANGMPWAIVFEPPIP